jgi:ClpX C4-type zinc finger protein
MVVDPKLLEQARSAEGRLASAEHEAKLARADYHTAIRRLHLAGTPLRELAQALSLSHQRVQQIVSATGGSWWNVWRRRGTVPDAVCTWCERPPSEVDKLIAGPKVFICDACVAAAERVLSDPRGARSSLRRATSGGRERCSFCRKRVSDTRPLVIGPANVCADCVRTCREIMEGRAS